MAAEGRDRMRYQMRESCFSCACGVLSYGATDRIAIFTVPCAEVQISLQCQTV